MPHEAWDYEAEEELYKTDGYGGTDADVASTEKFTSDIDLTDYIGAVIDFKFDGDNGTDDLIISLYRRRDDSWDGDEIAIQTASTVTNDGSEDIHNEVLLESDGPGHYRFGMKAESTSTTFELEVMMCRYRKVPR